MAGVNYTTSVVGLRDRWNIDFEEEPTMAKNKMAQVAAMFGKVIGERFRVKFLSENREGVFTESGLQTKDLDVWYINNAWLNYLLTGEAVILDE